MAPYYRRAAEILDRDASIVDVETPLVPGFVYRPFSFGAPTRFGLKYLDVLEKSSTIHTALASSVVGFDANASRSAVQTLTYFHHSSGTTHQLAIDPAQTVVLAGGGIGNAQLLLQPRADGAVPVGNESGQAGQFLMVHPHLDFVAEVVLDEDLDRQPMPAAFGNAVHAVVPDNAQTMRHGLLGCSVVCFDKTTENPMVEYLSRVYGKPFYHYGGSVTSEMSPSASNRVFLTGERAAAGFYRPGVRCVLDAGDFLNAETTFAAPRRITDRVAEGPGAHSQPQLVRGGVSRWRAHHGNDQNGRESVEFRGRSRLPGARVPQPVRGWIVRVSHRRLREPDADDRRAIATIG